MPKKPAPKAKPAKKRQSPILYWIWLAILVLIAVLSDWGNDRFWLGTLVASIPTICYPVATFALFIWACFNKRFKARWAPLLLAFGICVHLSGFHFGFMIGSDGKKLKVMSWNLHHGEFGLPGIVATIKAENPDVILLQEIHELEGPLRPIEGLFKSLPEYRATGDKESAILTKLPIESGKVHELNLNSDRRYIPEVKLRFDGQLLTFYTTHLYNGFRPVWLRTPGSLIYWSKKAQEDREDQIKELDKVVSKGSYTILGGDFNTIPKGGVYKHFASRFGDSFKNSGRGVGWTFPANFPVVRIDYLWTTQDIVTAEYREVNSNASDHLPIIAEYVMKK